MHIININIWSSLIIFTNDTSWGEIVYDVKALTCGYLKTNVFVFAEAKMSTISK